MYFLTDNPLNPTIDMQQLSYQIFLLPNSNFRLVCQSNMSNKHFPRRPSPPNRSNRTTLTSGSESSASTPALGSTPKNMTEVDCSDRYIAQGRGYVELCPDTLRHTQATPLIRNDADLMMVRATLRRNDPVCAVNSTRTITQQ